MAIYVSLTSIYRNQKELYLTLQSVVKQSRQPDKIFLYLSEEPSFFDTGFADKQITDKDLNSLLSKHQDLIHIAWGKDIGPYGKLLPLLKEKWDEDCFIITIDDDTEYHTDLIKNLVDDYMIHKCVISYRGFIPNIKHISELTYDNRIMNIGLQYVSNAEHNKHLYNFPTGKGGVLYHPSFFHKTGQLIFENKIYLDTCSTADDIWFMLIRVLNNVPCFLMARRWCDKDNSTSGLFVNFNHNHNKNNVFIRNTIERLKQIHDFALEKEMLDVSYENKKVVFHGIRNDHIAKTWERNLFYEDRLLEKIKRMELHGTYVDVGAHHGNHSLFFSKFCFPEKVIAIEGNPFNFECLKENVAANHCLNIHCMSVLASSTEGDTREMTYTLKNTGASTMMTDIKPTPDLRRVSNITNTLDNLLKTTENICLMKIDVQQHEYETLQGCKAIITKHKPVLAISIHANQNESFIKNFLSDLRYVSDNINYGVSGTFLYSFQS